MIGAVIFLGAVVAGVTQLFKVLRNKEYDRAVIIVVAVVVGAILSLVDTQIGVENISFAYGVMLGLSAAGVVAVAEKVG